jgi:hypothetical protein
MEHFIYKINKLPLTPTRDTAKPSAIVDSALLNNGLPALTELWNDGQRSDSAD